MDLILKEISDQFLPYKHPLSVGIRQRKFKKYETRPSVMLDGRKRRLCVPT